MSRTLTSGVQTEVAASHLRPFYLAELDFSSGFARVWSGWGPLSWNGHTWTGTGTFGTVSQPEETVEGVATHLDFSLSGIPSSLLSVFLGEHYRGRTARLYRGFFNSSNAIVADPFVMFAGKMEQCQMIEQGETSTIVVSAESELADLYRTRERRYSDQDQQEQFAGDLGLEFIAGIESKEIVWGRSEGALVGTAVLPPVTRVGPLGMQPR